MIYILPIILWPEFDSPLLMQPGSIILIPINLIIGRTVKPGGLC